jgi:hypothetical protein
VSIGQLLLSFCTSASRISTQSLISVRSGLSELKRLHLGILPSGVPTPVIAANWLEKLV